MVKDIIKRTIVNIALNFKKWEINKYKQTFLKKAKIIKY
jgi:hypothetical protein